jgi:hypothetical protein
MTGEAFEHVPKPAILETLVIDTPDGTRTPTILAIEHRRSCIRPMPTSHASSGSGGAIPWREDSYSG